MSFATFSVSLEGSWGCCHEAGAKWVWMLGAIDHSQLKKKSILALNSLILLKTQPCITHSHTSFSFLHLTPAADTGTWCLLVRTTGRWSHLQWSREVIPLYTVRTLRVASCLRPKARLCVSKNNMIPFGDHSLTYGLRTKIYQLVSWDSREPTLGCSAMKDIEFASGRNWKQVCHRGRQRTQMPQSESFCSASPMISKSSASRRLGSCSPQLLLWPNPTASCLEAKERQRETWVPRECVNTSLHGH